MRTMHYCSARTPCIHRERSSLTITRQILLSLKKNEDRRTNKKYTVGPEGFAGDAFFFVFFLRERTMIRLFLDGFTKNESLYL